MTTTLIKEQDDLVFKADFFPMTVIKLSNTDPASIKRQIKTTLIAAPNYFKNAPVVIDMQTIDTSHPIDLAAICQLLRDENMIPVGVRGLNKPQETDALANGLAIMKAPNSLKKKKIPSLTSGQAKRENAKLISPSQPKQNTITTKLVTAPIRSGTQMYARGGDLVVTAAVNAGGECFADGNIHVYGPLRGKALAGVNGNENARIFCETLEAELIAISGHYVTREQLNVPKTDKPMIQIYLKNGKIQIDSI